jgi:ribulose-5-phosphate 4-epimerase/fuculose-1-phosphate aldolase
VGRTVAEAFVLMHLLERAAQVQLQAQAAGAALVCVPAEVIARTQAQWMGDGSVPEGQDEWPALLRQLRDQDPDFFGEEDAPDPC